MQRFDMTLQHCLAAIQNLAGPFGFDITGVSLLIWSSLMTQRLTTLLSKFFLSVDWFMMVGYLNAGTWSSNKFISSLAMSAAFGLIVVLLGDALRTTRRQMQVSEEVHA